MNLENIFKKQVDRKIEGVIKADDDASLRLELDEYVITLEVAKRLDEFLDAYLNYAGANGVWISGFFGSGKSHLLKMLALLLENKTIGDARPLEIFLTKAPLSEGGIFASDLQRAVAIPSESILFNIDQKADVISKTEIDALIAVFVKVFDEHCGYYGKQAYIAQFERDLDADGLLGDFKDAFESNAGMSWDKGRARAKRMASSVDASYNQVSNESVSDILDKYRSDYRLSIEDFADQVKTYIDKQEANFRLNFFVDEVGQYIADNVKLMTNLQTVAESLATKCKGQAWVIVTAQEDMSTVVGETGKQQSNDFTKIQARFKNRMKLTSQDVAEVIQRRLLEKKEEVIPELSDLFHKQENNFKTLFDFADGSATYRNYRDREHFVQSYPFIPYQFSLFQSAIQSLSVHSAFEGKHSSVGERSMLGVFQEVAVTIKEHQIGELATFDLMFEGIRTALKTAIQQSIIKAENNLDNQFGVRLLKALFLVKYVKEFKPSIRNLCVLMHGSFDRDILSLKLDIEEALNLLEKQTYIQRNGDLYEYLTDEEQDIEQEIKYTEIDNSVVAGELEKLVYDGILKTRKIRWEENNQDYPFSRRLDDALSGREYELAIHVISPFHELSDQLEKHKTDTVYAHEVRIVMPDNERLVRDLILYKQTEKYVAHETRTTQQDSTKRILTEKGIQNAERLAQLKALTAKLIGSAKYYVSGQDLELSGDDGQSKMIRAFGELIKHTYPNLRMLRDLSYTEKDIPNILSQAEQGLFGDETQLPESQQEMLSFIQSNSRGGIRTTVKSLLEKFESKPYGWSFSAVLCTLAHLCGRAKIEVRESTNLLDGSELVQALTNTGSHGNLILDPQVEFSQSQIRKVKEFYNDYFDKVAHATEVKALAKEVQEGFIEQANTLERFLAQSELYPFVRALSPILTELQELKDKPYTWFMSELAAYEDMWLDFKEETIDPILKFMRGPQRASFDEAKRLLAVQKPNLEYVTGDSHRQIAEALVNPDIYKGSAIQQLKANAVDLEKELEDLQAKEREQALAAIKALKDKLTGFEEYRALEHDNQYQLTSAFDVVTNRLNGQNLIAMLRDEVHRFEERTYAGLVQQLMAWSQPAPKLKPELKPAGGKEENEPYSSDSDCQKPALTPEPPQTIAAKHLKVDFHRPWLASEKDVEQYLEEYKKSLLAAIEDGKHIQL
ncbi:hypothetical protein BST95_12660 [Halioglobus japonicus]|uniref:BREX system P-loop protein BrxC n=1 Tax=Halioglobus japonicus TaxID=930805 RepID=A0AAP8SPZ4_9GAMM|nr:BREX system P-loop protein BrxC [Halioglobus japonicus]AQA18966.1 hypothetical protein BST95_12660 [Halioglobus japonicus]PLW88019.1 BREX system P-loop protein BrxC [Halioglobus japonicus]GHD20477.1 hypothetical protein GCM10007052_30150 [Halioglobus japonicus]